MSVIFKPTEAQEQEALFSWAEMCLGKYPELALLHHITNEGKRSEANGAALKRQGLKKGVPDIHLPVARGAFHSLYIEMKRIGEKTTAEQEKWIAMLRKEANCCYVADKGWQDAAEFILNYLNLEE